MTKHYMLQALNENKESVYIDDVPNGKSCNCTCAECGGKLVAKNNGKIKVHHFAHENGNDTIKCSETSLHLLAKKIIVEEKRIPSFVNGQIRFVSVEAVEEEKNLGDIKPDLYAEYNGRPVAIEIYVSHAIDEIKFKKIQNHKLTTFEVDLSKIAFEQKIDVVRTIYNINNIKLIYDEDCVQHYIKQKKMFIMTQGEFKPIENGVVRHCHMKGVVGYGGIVKWRNVSVSICRTCCFGYEVENKNGIFCVGHLKGAVPWWFVQTNISENRFMSLLETNEKLRFFIQRKF